MKVKVLPLLLATNFVTRCTHGFTSRIARKYTAISSLNPFSISERNTILNAKDDVDVEPVEEKEDFKSAALDWAKQQEEEINEAEEQDSHKKYVVVGGGWAGWGAVKALCQSGINAEVILLDALPDPTGVSHESNKSHLLRL